MKATNWFIQYGWRYAGDRSWHYTEAITDLHPVAWLVDLRKRAREEGWTSDYYIACALPITHLEAERWKGEVG